MCDKTADGGLICHKVQVKWGAMNRARGLRDSTFVGPALGHRI
jgi:hypothetical protein